MRKHFEFNFVAKTIEGSKSAISRANKGMNPEFKELCEMIKAQPTFTITVKVINQKEGKEKYHDLTFERMKLYISLQTDAEKKLAEFEAIKKVAKAKGAMYPLTKKWFINTYKNYKESDIAKMESAELEKLAA